IRMPAPSTLPAKAAPRQRGKSIKKEKENQPGGSNHPIDIDAIAEIPVPSTPPAKAAPGRESIVEPPKEVPQEVISDRGATMKCTFPFDNPLEILGTDVDGAIKAVRKAVTDVLDDHKVRCHIPVVEMERISKSIEKKLGNRKMDRVKGSRPVLEGTLDEVFSLLSERKLGMDKSIFRQELLKYILIASSQLEKLSTETLLSIVQDLSGDAFNLTGYDIDYPKRISSTVSKFYGLTDKEFESLNEPIQSKMKKEYVKAGIHHCEEVEKLLDEKHNRLKERGNGDPINLWMDGPEGQVKEDKLIESSKKNREMEKQLRIEYGILQEKEEEAGMGRYRVDFRTMCLRGRIGVLAKEEDEQIDKEFHLSPFRVIKMAVDSWKKGNEEGANKKAMEKEKEMDVNDVPSNRTRNRRKRESNPLR
ncbi:hypothetical protein PENTCL1PPCAC_26762, partial [Pristionchus entomophagus]